MFYFKSSKTTYFLNRVLVYIYLPKASKYLYISLSIYIFLPRASNSLYISVSFDFQIAISWYVLYSISLSAQVYVQIQSDDSFYPAHKELCPYYSVIPPHTGLCSLRQCYSHINSYVPYCSVKPPHKELFPYFNIILAHTEL